MRNGRGSRGIAVIAFGAVVGAAVVASPLLSSAFVGTFLAASATLILKVDLPRIYLRTLTVLLFGYAFFGRGFAHLGIYPVFVGEIVLAAGIAALAARGLSTITRLPLARIIFCFLIWNLICTLPYVSRYGADTARDAVIWGYCVFALALAASLGTGFRLDSVPRAYARSIPIFLTWAPILLLLFRLRQNWIPLIPGSDVPLLGFVPGDTGVHLAGIAAFMLLRPDMPGKASALALARRVALWSLWIVSFIGVSSLGRGGMLSILVGVLVALLLRASPMSWLRIGFFVAFSGLILIGVNPEVDIGGPRDLSVRQVILNLGSVTGTVNYHALDSTREWRLAWWNKIVGYTLHGPHFWNGKGFGINLADADGFQVEDGPWTLRSPHNGHLTVLARSGVVGLALWALLQGAFLVSLTSSYFKSRSRGNHALERTCAWILAYWVAAQVNIAFGTALESPHAGIWVWSIFGYGLAVLQQRSSLSPVADSRGSPAVPPLWQRRAASTECGKFVGTASSFATTRLGTDGIRA